MIREFAPLLGYLIATCAALWVLHAGNQDRLKRTTNLPLFMRIGIFVVFLFTCVLAWFFINELVRIILIGYTLPWTGFSATSSPGDMTQVKTLWDWMELLLIPLFLAGGALFLNRSERGNERLLAIDHQQEAALQAYLDRMSELLLQKKLRTTANEEVRNVARIRTLTVLRELDPSRKLLVLQFLKEANLLAKEEPIVSLRGVVFNSIDLSKVDLTDVNLSHTTLFLVNLKDAKMKGVDLSNAALFQCDLRHADLSGANLTKTRLLQCNLKNANLEQADLTGAFLISTKVDSARLTNANLSGVSGIAQKYRTSSSPSAVTLRESAEPE